MYRRHIYIDDSPSPELDGEIFINGEYRNLSLRDYESRLENAERNSKLQDNPDFRGKWTYK